MRTQIAALLAIAIVSIACGGAGTPHSTEVAKVRSGDLDVVLLAGTTALGQGKDTATLEFRSAADGSLVNVGMVKAAATMPMAGMAPMSGAVSVEPMSTAGRYLIASDLGMAGQWRLTIEWDGPAGRGTANFTPLVQ